MQKSALLKTRESHFSLAWVIELSIIFSCLSKSQSFSNNASLPILVDIQRLHENGK